MRACGAGLPAIQSNTAPRTVPDGMLGPVANTVRNDWLAALSRRSVSPGRTVTEYAVPGRHPRWGRTTRVVRSHDTSGGPSLGEMMTSWSSVCAPRGRSFTTSSKMKRTARGVVLSEPLSGMTRTSLGGVVSGGPPGGIPCDAQPTAAATMPAAMPAVIVARVRVTRRVTPAWPRAARRGPSIRVPSRVRPRRWPAAPSP